MSTSDDQLDALYRRTRATDPGLQSPDDLDAAIRAAAASATAQTTPTGASDVQDRSRWASRYGWATAATLLLTTTLFLALPDADLSNTSEITTIPNKQSTDRSHVPIAHVPAETDTRSSMAQNADRTAGADANTDLSATPIAIAAESEGTLSPAPSPALIAPPVPSSTPPSAPAPSADRMPPPKLSHQSIEEVVVTGSRRAPSKCTRFDDLLIERLCEVPSTAKRSTSTPHPPSEVKEFRLFASAQSPCRGQSLQVQTQANALTFHDTSSKRRVVLLESSGDSSAEPTEEVICKFGRLKVQSLARGR